MRSYNTTYPTKLHTPIHVLCLSGYNFHRPSGIFSVRRSETTRTNNKRSHSSNNEREAALQAYRKPNKDVGAAGACELSVVRFEEA